MKRLRNIITVLAVMAITTISCTKDNEQPLQVLDSKLVGEWHLIGIKSDGKLINQDTDVYLDLKADGTFELYQKTGSQNVRYDRYTGRCRTENGVLSGEYSDGMPWGSRYEYAKTLNGFTLKSYNLLEEQRYITAEIPEEVRTNANHIGTKSAASGSPIL